jgi:hypothetical protein
MIKILWNTGRYTSRGKGVVESLTTYLGLLQSEVTNGKKIMETDLGRNRQERAEMIEQHRQKIVGM